MPKIQKRQKQTRAETTAEEFFPVKPEDLKYSIEKQVKQIDVSSLTTIEKEGKKMQEKPVKAKKARAKKTSKQKAKKSQRKQQWILLQKK